MRSALAQLLLSGGPLPGGCSPVARAPLPPFPACGSCPTPESYDKVLPWTPPTDRDFLRANAWAVTVPGLPFVPGGSSEHPERFLSYLAYKYTPDWRAKAWQATCERSYTHVVHSWPDARSDGGLSIDQFIGLVEESKRYIQYAIVFLGAKGYDPQDQTFDEWRMRVNGPLQALLTSGAVDEVVPSWEHNLFNVPGDPTISYFKWVGQQAHLYDVSCWAHFSIEVTSWFKDGDPRGRYGFWDDLGGDVDGLMYQSSAEWDIGETQARLVDTLNQFARQGNVHKLRAFEYLASAQFTQDHPNEDDGDLWGYLSCCTAGPTVVWGFGGGGRHVDGSPI